MFSYLIARFVPKHTWDTECIEEQRTCQVCGRVESYKDTDGWVAPAWRPLHAGDKRAHVVAAKLAAAKVQSPVIQGLQDETTQPQPTSLA
jgi:hypothetical protein